MFTDSRASRSLGPGSPSTEFRSDINGLRALSVVLVVCFHAQVTGASGGFVGVDVFFVISGFLMTRIILDRMDAATFSFWSFMRARAARIWPALAAMVLTLLVLGSLSLPPSDVKQIADQAIWALSFLSNQYFLAHAGYGTDGADGNWFVHTWSLSIEWQFYILYPLVLWLIVRPGTRTGAAHQRLAAVRLTVLSLLALSLGLYVVLCAWNPSSAFFLLPARAWELLAGGVVYLAGDRVLTQRPRLRAVVSYAGVALVVLSALGLAVVHADAVGIGWRSIVPVVGAMLVIWAAAPHNRLLDNRAAQSIGRWSYSIYLWHWPLVVVCAMDAGLLRHPLTARVSILGASVLLGALSYRLVESRQASVPRAGPRIAAAQPLVAVVLAVIATAVAVASNGLEFRMPHNFDSPEAKQALESDYFPAACSNFQKRIEDVHPCRIVKPSDRAVLVIGDSLAEALYPWFKAHSAVSVDFLTESECPPVPAFERLQPGFHCKDYAELAWREAVEGHYDTVILTANWRLVGGLGPSYCHVDLDGGCRIVNGDERRDLMLAEMRAGIRRVLAAGKTVVVLDGSPTTYLNIPQRLDRERYWFGEPRFRIPLASVVADNAWIDPLWAEFEGLPRFHRVSLRPTLCDASACRVYDEKLDRPIYIDERHFDPVWIAHNGGIFAPFVTPVPPS